MHKQRSTTGQRGEEAAAAYLVQSGYTVLGRNWHCKSGELDIIAQDAQAVIVFVEVKTSTREGQHNALENITPAKRQRLVASVYAYLEAHHLTEAKWRIDAISVLMVHQAAPVIEHVEDVLDW